VPRPNKKARYTRVIPIRLTEEQWLAILNEGNKDKLDPSVWIRKTILEKLNGSRKGKE
jgi:hypothetical protein